MPNKEQNKATPAPTGAQAPEDIKPATMEVPVERMEAIMSRLEAAEQRDLERDEEMRLLREQVNRGTPDDAEEKEKKGPPRAQVMIHNGKVVTSWKMEKNELVYNPINMIAPVSEDLQISVTYADGDKSGPMKYVDFVRNKERAFVTKLGQDGIMWIVQFEDPSISMDKLTIDPQFLNP